MTAIKERPILFSGEMVRAILAGTKTQTRRVIKEAWDHCEPDKEYLGEFRCWKDHEGYRSLECPYGFLGEQLWVRETWQPHCDGHNTEEAEYGIRYRADQAFVMASTTDDHNRISWKYDDGIDSDITEDKWRPSIHMPRWASRIDLKITDVRVERLQDISEEDVHAEGTFDADIGHIGAMTCDQWKLAWQTLWDSINDSRGFGWNVNPWVWVVEFERIGADG